MQCRVLSIGCDVEVVVLLFSMDSSLDLREIDRRLCVCWPRLSLEVNNKDSIILEAIIVAIVLNSGSENLLEALATLAGAERNLRGEAVVRQIDVRIVPCANNVRQAQVILLLELVVLGFLLSLADSIDDTSKHYVISKVCQVLLFAQLQLRSRSSDSALYRDTSRLGLGYCFTGSAYSTIRATGVSLGWEVVGLVLHC